MVKASINHSKLIYYACIYRSLHGIATEDYFVRQIGCGIFDGGEVSHWSGCDNGNVNRHRPPRGAPPCCYCSGLFQINWLSEATAKTKQKLATITMI